MDVVGVGYPLQDILVRIEKIPVVRKQPASKILSSSWQGGGMVPTGLCAASMLGASAGIIGVIGDDAYGKSCMKDFEMNGVATDHVLVDENGSTSYSIVLTETSTSERCFVFGTGTRRELKPEELDEEYIGQAKYLLLANMDPISVRAAQIAKAHGTKVVIDADRYEERTMEHLDLIDVFICSEEFYNDIYDDENYVERLSEIQKKGPEVSLITLGEKGCKGLFGDVVIDEKAFTNITVMDTNGAGDVFHGAFIYGMLQGWEPKEVVRFASATSAVKCTRQGGRAGLAKAETIRKFMETGEIDYTEIDKRVEIYRTGLI